MIFVLSAFQLLFNWSISCSVTYSGGVGKSGGGGDAGRNINGAKARSFVFRNPLRIIPALIWYFTKPIGDPWVNMFDHPVCFPPWKEGGRDVLELAALLSFPTSGMTISKARSAGGLLESPSGRDQSV